MWLTIGVAVVWMVLGAFVGYKFAKNAGTSGDDHE